MAKGVKKFVLVTSIGTGDSKDAPPSQVYDVLKPVLLEKEKAEERLKVGTKCPHSVCSMCSSAHLADVAGMRLWARRHARVIDARAALLKLEFKRQKCQRSISDGVPEEHRLLAAASRWSGAVDNHQARRLEE